MNSVSKLHKKNVCRQKSLLRFSDFNIQTKLLPVFLSNFAAENYFLGYKSQQKKLRNIIKILFSNEKVFDFRSNGTCLL